MARLTVALGSLTVLLWACQGTDGPTTPPTSALTPREALADRSGSRNSTDTVFVLKRTNPIAADVSVSADIGPKGGEIRIDAAGVRFSVLPGSLASTVHITMTAKAGSDIAYEFAPHGLVFAKPATVRQDLKVSSVWKFPRLYDQIVGGYYEGSLTDAFVDARHRLVKVKETRDGTADPRGAQFSFTINHFSGYILASGRSFDYDID